MMTLIFLVLTMAVTPLRKITGWNWLIQFRRMLGLYAFFYGCLHFLCFFSLDRGFSVSSTLTEMLKRKYLIVGSTALIVMIPLAITSTNAMIKRLGGKRWRALHRLAYVAAICRGDSLLHAGESRRAPAAGVRGGAGRPARLAAVELLAATQARAGAGGQTESGSIAFGRIMTLSLFGVPPSGGSGGISQFAAKRGTPNLKSRFLKNSVKMHPGIRASQILLDKNETREYGRLRQRNSGIVLSLWIF